MIVILLVMMVVVMIVMYLYISDLCWSSGCQVRASFWNSNPADPESRFEGQNMMIHCPSRVGVLELDQGSNCPSHCQGWGGGDWVRIGAYFNKTRWKTHEDTSLKWWFHWSYLLDPMQLVNISVEVCEIVVSHPYHIKWEAMWTIFPQIMDDHIPQ